MRLLEPIRQTEMPPDYLLARICNRRVLLDQASPQGQVGSEEPLRALQREYVWVFKNLNSFLRKQLRPFFEYQELRTLVRRFRWLVAGEEGPRPEFAEDELLCRPCRKLLQTAADPLPALVGLEQLFADDYPCFRTLAETFLRQGPGGVEQVLLGGYLEWTGKDISFPPMRLLVQGLIDNRNLLGLYKHLRWRLELQPVLLEGGSLSVTLLEKIWLARDMTRVLHLVNRVSGLKSAPETAGIELLLLAGLTRRLRHYRRQPLHPGQLLDYLWQCRIAARNHGLWLYLGDDRETLAEMVI